MNRALRLRYGTGNGPREATLSVESRDLGRSTGRRVTLALDTEEGRPFAELDSQEAIELAVWLLEDAGRVDLAQRVRAPAAISPNPPPWIPETPA